MIKKKYMCSISIWSIYYLYIKKIFFIHAEHIAHILKKKNMTAQLHQNLIIQPYLERIFSSISLQEEFRYHSIHYDINYINTFLISIFEWLEKFIQPPGCRYSGLAIRKYLINVLKLPDALMKTIEDKKWTKEQQLERLNLLGLKFYYKYTIYLSLLCEKKSLEEKLIQYRTTVKYYLHCTEFIFLIENQMKSLGIQPTVDPSYNQLLNECDIIKAQLREYQEKDKQNQNINTLIIPTTTTTTSTPTTPVQTYSLFSNNNSTTLIDLTVVDIKKESVEQKKQREEKELKLQQKKWEREEKKKKA